MMEALTILGASMYGFSAGIYLMGCRFARMSWGKSVLHAVFWPVAFTGEIINRGGDKK